MTHQYQKYKQDSPEWAERFDMKMLEKVWRGLNELKNLR